MSDRTPAERVARYLAGLNNNHPEWAVATPSAPDLSALLAQREALLEALAEIQKLSLGAIRDGISAAHYCEDIYNAAVVAVALATSDDPPRPPAD